MFYDKLSNRYYERNNDGSKQYAVGESPKAEPVAEQMAIPLPPPPDGSVEDAFAGQQLEIK